MARPRSVCTILRPFDFVLMGGSQRRLSKERRENKPAGQNSAHRRRDSLDGLEGSCDAERRRFLLWQLPKAYPPSMGAAT